METEGLDISGTVNISDVLGEWRVGEVLIMLDWDVGILGDLVAGMGGWVSMG